MDFRTQESYFESLEVRYNQIQSTHGVEIGLHNAFASLSLVSKSLPSPISNKIRPSTSDELSMILIAMRKIREAIVASNRHDGFAVKAYIWMIRATILLGHMESYLPALLHLLYKIHPIKPLAGPEYHEILGFYVLDLACRQDDLAAAWGIKSRYGLADVRIEPVLKAIIHGNWCRFWSLHDLVNAHQKALMECAGNRMRMHTLKCFGKTYISVERIFIEKSVQRPWEELREEDNLLWHSDRNIVIIRRINRKC